MSVIFLVVNLTKFWQVEKYPVSIAVSKTPLSAPFYVATAIKAFDSTCVEVEIKDVIGGGVAFNKVIKGEVDFATSSDSVIAFQSLNRLPFVTHAMFAQSDNDVKLITRSDDNLAGTSSLQGKIIGVTKKTASEYFLSTLLAIDGVNAQDVSLVHYEPAKLVDGLMNNEVDAIVPWEPFAFQSKQIFDKKVTIHDTKNLNTLSFNLVSLVPDRARIEKATCVLQGLNTAINYIASHPDKAKEIINSKLDLSTEFINWIWPDYLFKLELNQSLLLNLNSQTAWLAETHSNIIKQVPNMNQFVDSRAILQVNPSAVNISR
ncbi:ABC transporter substrate-binding protein [Thalassotalea sp. SU-HH00458]|uniref:ABC transporter substrate-binding protein n=1 Tax=Thalassotalea sp. SU-HH00458 TaxID=3127657 RepID=UPI0031055DBE